MDHTWTVISQNERTGQLADGSYGTVVRITYRTAAGVVRSIDVPASEYHVDRVRELIDAAAARTDEVQSL